MILTKAQHQISGDDFFFLKQMALKSQMVKSEAKTLPLIVWIILVSTCSALIGGEGVLDFKMAGLAWFIPLLFSILLILRNPNQISFPFKLWIPWIILLMIYLITSEYQSLQRTIQLMCPIVIGIAVSTQNINVSQIKRFIVRCKHLSVALILIALWHTGTLLTGKIPLTTGLAPQSITAILFCCLFAASYASGNRKDLYWWGLMVGVPIFAVTRTAIAVAGLTLPLTFAPLKLKKRIVLVIVGLGVALALFQTERIQKKMFYSGRGKLADIQSKDFSDTGRKFMWDLMKKRIEQRPWFGHGTGSSELFLKSLLGNRTYPHNDWLLTLQDQGILGTAVFAISMLVAVFHALRKAKTATFEARLLFLAGASAFVSMALMMITDNIMVYASYFGNLHFTILGLAYASEKNKKKAGEPLS
ncbi:O-antigen ligase family protein [Thermodesulfobacteriota bacterium]